ncbi:hypothetical protein FQA39_LY14445 [Lamprigera yunnana]|nr:hypothetical protein FQA39_LY14445 [Lamprigera yunnana]
MRIWKEMKFLVFLGINSVILQILQCIVLAGPAKRSSRMIREVYPEIESEKLETSQAEVCIVGDVVYGAEEPVPADQPCLKCKCEPPGVQCETTRCIKKPGCKAIHKPNECCPEYQCECEYSGKSYANGERLERTPGGECKVCYCRGGEVQCAEVSCYIRTDCEGRTVPGQCCPKYDHCPPRDPIIDRPYTAQPTSTGVETWSSNSTSENQLTTSNEKEVLQKIDMLKKEDVPKITIQEIIPEIKEIPITGPPKLEISLLTHAQGMETQASNKIQRDDLTDTETESSEISEIYHHPPPILKIGDQLLVLKKGELIPKQDISTPRPVITVIGAEGLQRGTEDSGETHEIILKNDDSPKIASEDEKVNRTDNISIGKNVATTTPPATEDATKLEDFLNVTSTIDNTDKTQNTSSNVESTTNVQYVFVSDVYSDNVSSVIPLMEEHNSSDVTDVSSVSTESFIEKGNHHSSTSESSKNKHEDDIIIDQNPEYPPIPDIMIPQSLDEVDHLDSEFVHVNVDDHMNTTEEHEKHGNKSEHSLINAEASLPTFLLESVAPSDQTANDDDVSKSIKDLNSTSEDANYDKSKETIEEMVSEESGEFTTSANSYSAPMLSVEDASVESAKFNWSELMTNTPDVEVFNTQLIIDSKHLENESTRKRFASKFGIKLDNRDTDVYKLADDLKTTPSHIIDNKTGNEDVEAEAIFRELLEEATSSMPPQEDGLSEGRQKESALLKRVSEAILKYQAKESKESLDASVLGILRDFFSSQYKYYEKKN